MIDIDSLKRVAKAVNQWSNCNKAWLDTSEDDSCAVVGHIDDDGNCYAVATIDCDQYYAGQDSLPLAKFYANSNPAIILELIECLESSDKQRDELLAAAEAIEIDAEECLDFDECTAMLVPIDTYHKLMEAIASVKGGAA